LHQNITLVVLPFMLALATISDVPELSAIPLDVKQRKPADQKSAGFLCFYVLWLFMQQRQ
jgi:hypothetical protein